MMMEYLVLDLPLAAGAATQALNEHAQRGWQLKSVVYYVSNSVSVILERHADQTAAGG